MSDKLVQIIEDFGLFSDWEDRYRYLIDIGRTLPKMDEALKTDENLVRGCTSRVWMVIDTTGGVLRFTADSDAHIVRGLIALLDRVYNGEKAENIPQIDIAGAFADIGLDAHLSPNRRSGFFSMVERIRSVTA